VTYYATKIKINNYDNRSFACGCFFDCSRLHIIDQPSNSDTYAYPNADSNSDTYAYPNADSNADSSAYSNAVSSAYCERSDRLYDRIYELYCI
jgi:hypothetical protein